MQVSQFLRRARGAMVSYGPAQYLTTGVVVSKRCGILSVYLDGQPLTPTGRKPTNFLGRPTPGLEPAWDINVIPLSMVSAIEVYTDLASVPAKYRFPGQECGRCFCGQAEFAHWFSESDMSTVTPRADDTSVATSS
ncbi:MAG: hypothetical protein ABJF01_23215 [bacterium]